jgi:hypothetical protein
MGHLPADFFMEWNDLPPGRPIPQALVDPALAVSRSSDGQAAWAAERISRPAQNCNTSPQSAVEQALCR